MADPFANIRRRPAATATYGRKALAARRAAVPASSFSAAAASAVNTGARKSPVHLPATHAQGKANNKNGSSGNSSGSSSSESDGGEETADVADRPWVRRTAHLAISKLDSLYESTRPAESFGGSRSTNKSAQGSAASINVAPSSSREVLESTKDKWDLGGVPSDPIPATTAIISKKAPPSKQIDKSPQPKRTVGGSNKAIKKAKSAQPSTRVKGSKVDKTVKPKPASIGRAIKGTVVTTRISGCRTGSNTIKTPPASHPASSDCEASISVFEMSDLLSSSPICTRSKGPRRLARSKCKRGPVLEDNDSLLSSSPPSTPGRLVESGKNSQLFGSRAGSEISDNDSIREHATRTVAVPSSVADVSVTPVAQVGNRQVLDSMQGPSTATSKRLQMRAYTHNVVYTYGRSRDDEDYGLGDGSDALGSELSPTLRLQATFEPTGRLALESTQNDGNQRVAGTLLDLVDPVNRNTSNECEQPMPGGSFKQQISDIIHGLGTASRSADSASSSPCEKLLSKLEDQNFCDDLISSKSRLSALVHALGRIRDDPVVLSTTAVLIAVAFQTPTAMQMLVFEKQILEIVAGILKAVTTGTLPDILALRRRHGFDTPAQYGCAEQICRLAHGHGLLFGGKIPLSSYNLVLCALYGFSRNDDVAFVAMAPLLRNEMHESGCLGLIAERSVALSVPALVKQQSKSSFTGSNIAAARGMVDKGSNPYRQPLLPSDDDSGNNNNDDDEWMDFDLPEETKKAPASFTGKKLKRKATSVTDPTEHNDRSAKVFDRSLAQEASATVPSLASIGIELEILRFCIAANVENQEELLSIEACVPTLLNLVASCQQTCTRASILDLNQALEVLALGLQLLVNLSYGSTAFCSRFFASEGLAIVAKSIALMSRGLAATTDKQSSSVRDQRAFTTGRNARLADDTNILKYDVLLISCALLINVVESDPSSIVYFGHVLQSPRCQLTGKCFPVCACIDKIPLVALITDAFLGRCSEEASNKDASVTAGYLAVLLGFLVCDPGPVRHTILEQLPGKNTSTLLEHIRNFVHISSTVNQNIASSLLNGLGIASGDSQQQSIRHRQCLPSPHGQHYQLPPHEDGLRVINPRSRSRLDVYGKKQALPASLQSVIDMLGKL